MTSITCDAPPGTEGLKTVTVEATYNGSFLVIGELLGGYTYTEPDKIVGEYTDVYF